MKNSRPRLIASLATAALLLCRPPSSAGQDVEEIRQHGIFAESIDVTVVNVEVIVTDQQGRPVTGLTSEDFQVFEDGRLVELTNFLAFSAPPTESVFEVEAPATAPLEPASAAASPSKRQHAIVLFDNGHVSPQNRNALISRLRDEIQRLMGPDTWVMVVTKDREIKIVRRMTNDRNLVLAALDRIEETAGGGALEDAQERMLMRRLDLGRTAGPSGSAAGALAVDLAEQDARDMLGAIEMQAQQTAQEVRYTCEVLRYFIDSLAGIPGRKALFYVSEGLPLRAGESLFRVWYDKWGSTYGADLGVSSPLERAEEYDSTQNLLDLIAHSNANRVAFYPIDVSRGVGSLSVSAANSDVSLASTILTVGESKQIALGLLAQGTGGRSLPETVGLGEFVDQARQDFETAYLLGFVSPNQGDGEVHDIEVRVVRQGLRLRYRDRYRAKSADQVMTDKTLAALFLDSAENPLEVQVGMSDSVRADKKKGEYVLPLEVRLPLAKLALIPEEARHVGSISLFIIVQDDKGRLSPPVKIGVPVKIPNDKLVSSLAQNVGYRTKLRVRAGGQKIAVGVRDDLSQISSAINLSVDVGES